MHIIWEAKSQYVYPYYLSCCPAVQRKWHCFQKKSIFQETPEDTGKVRGNRGMIAVKIGDGMGNSCLIMPADMPRQGGMAIRWFLIFQNVTILHCGILNWTSFI